MELSVPQQVLQRALSNRPASLRAPLPKFGTIDWRASLGVGAGTVSTVTLPSFPSSALLYDGEPLTLNGNFITLNGTSVIPDSDFNPSTALTYLGDALTYNGNYLTFL